MKLTRKLNSKFQNKYSVVYFNIIVKEFEQKRVQEIDLLLEHKFQTMKILMTFA